MKRLFRWITRHFAPQPEIVTGCRVEINERVRRLQDKDVYIFRPPVR